MEMTEQHIEVMEAIKDGATVWGYVDAKLIREVQRYDESLVHILGLKELEEIVDEKFDGTKQLPYFGAILTGAGRDYLDKYIESESK